MKEVFLQSDFAMVFVQPRIPLHFVKCVSRVGWSGKLELLIGELGYSSGGQEVNGWVLRGGHWRRLCVGRDEGERSPGALGVPGLRAGQVSVGTCGEPPPRPRQSPRVILAAGGAARRRPGGRAKTPAGWAGF